MYTFQLAISEKKLIKNMYIGCLLRKLSTFWEIRIYSRAECLIKKYVMTHQESSDRFALVIKNFSVN